MSYMILELSWRLVASSPAMRSKAMKLVLACAVMTSRAEALLHSRASHARRRASPCCSMAAPVPIMTSSAPLLGQAVIAGAAFHAARTTLTEVKRDPDESSAALAPVSSFYGNSLVFLSRIIYHSRRSHPLSAWGELLLLLLENVICVGVLHARSPERVGLLRPWLSGRAASAAPSARWLYVLTDLMLLSASGVVLLLLPTQLSTLTMAISAPLLLSSYFVTVLNNLLNRSTGRLGVSAVALRCVGAMTRCVTTVALLRADAVVLINHLLEAAGCALLLVQLWWFQTRKAPSRRARLQRLLRARQTANAAQRRNNLAAALMWRSLGGFGGEVFADGELPSATALRAIFDEIDVDGSGEISRDELQTYIVAGWGENQSEETVELMIGAADSDGDGFVNFDGAHSRVLRVPAGARYLRVYRPERATTRFSHELRRRARSNLALVSTGVRRVLPNHRERCRGGDGQQPAAIGVPRRAVAHATTVNRRRATSAIMMGQPLALAPVREGVCRTWRDERSKRRCMGTSMHATGTPGEQYRLSRNACFCLQHAGTGALRVQHSDRWFLFAACRPWRTAHAAQFDAYTARVGLSSVLTPYGRAAFCSGNAGGSRGTRRTRTGGGEASASATTVRIAPHCVPDCLRRGRGGVGCAARSTGLMRPTLPTVPRLCFEVTGVQGSSPSSRAPSPQTTKVQLVQEFLLYYNTVYLGNSYLATAVRL